jgi:hypothetical protein
LGGSQYERGDPVLPNEHHPAFIGIARYLCIDFVGQNLDPWRQTGAATSGKQASGSAKIDPLMAAFNVPLAVLKIAALQIRPHSSKSRTPSAVIATLLGGSPAPTNQPLTSA